MTMQNYSTGSDYQATASAVFSGPGQAGCSENTPQKYPLIIFIAFRLLSKLDKVVSVPRYF